MRTIQSAFRVIGFSTLAILPWVLVHLPGVLRAGRIGVQWASTSVIAARYDSLAAREIPDLFSVAPSQYGNNPLAYDFLVGSLLCAGVASLLFIRGNRERVSRVQFPSVAAAAIALVAVCFLNAHLFAIDTAVRYSCPTIIGCFVMTLVCWLRHIHRPYPPNLRQRAVFVSTCFVVAIIVFAGNFRTRAFNAATNRTLLAFPIPPYYANHSLYFISSGELAYARSLQFKTQPASGVLVWEVAPFNLDFRRNPLYTVSESGLINPALRFPAGLDVAALRRYLCAMGIRYILLEVRGAFVRDERSLSELLKARAPVYRKLAEYGIYFRQSLARLAEQNRILYSDDRMLLFELADAGLRAPQ